MKALGKKKAKQKKYWATPLTIYITEAFKSI